MKSTTYTIAGMTTAKDARIVKDSLYHLADIGGVATEIVPASDSLIILKHKDDIELDRATIAAALRDAGDYTLS